MNKTLHIIAILACCAAISACTAREMDIPRGYDLSIATRVSDIAGGVTRTPLLDNASTIEALKLYGWENGTYWIQGKDASYDSESGKWTVPGGYKLVPGADYAFLAYSNLPDEGASVTASKTEDGPVITYTVTDIAAAQSDVLLGKAAISKPADGEVTIDFSHPYASVIFKVGNITGVSDAIKAISLVGIYGKGTTGLSRASEADGNDVVIYNWSDCGDPNATLELSGLNVSEGDSIASFVVIPQNLEENNAIVTVTYGEGGKLTKLLDKGEWPAGYTTMYTLYRTGDVETTMDGKTITNAGDTKIYVRAAVTGAWYDTDGNVVAPWSITDGTFDGGFPNTGWENVDGICYYSTPLAKDVSATDLFGDYTPPTAPVAGATLKLDILVQAIPYDVNKTCREAFEAL